MQEKPMRLDRFFSSQNLATRSQVREYLKKGRIKINGRPAEKPDEKILPGEDLVALDGTIQEYRKYRYLMLHKPQGVVSATEDRTHTTVLDLVPPELLRSGMFPAGRLDKDTTGFVLLTDDGNFAHRILSPNSHVDKTYHARLDGDVDEIMMRAFQEGVALKDGYVCKSAGIRTLEDGEFPLAEIIIHEGRYHQIKQMAAACGRHVLSLKRVKIGGLCLDPDLPEGGCREILHKELRGIL